jgi:hypothetical protein
MQKYPACRYHVPQSIFWFHLRFRLRNLAYAQSDLLVVPNHRPSMSEEAQTGEVLYERIHIVRRDTVIVCSASISFSNDDLWS